MNQNLKRTRLHYIDIYDWSKIWIYGIANLDIVAEDEIWYDIEYMLEAEENFHLSYRTVLLTHPLPDEQGT